MSVLLGWIPLIAQSPSGRYLISNQNLPGRLKGDLIARLRDPVPPSHGELIAKMHLVGGIFSPISSLVAFDFQRGEPALVANWMRGKPAWKRRLSFQKKESPVIPLPCLCSCQPRDKLALERRNRHCRVSSHRFLRVAQQYTFAICPDVQCRQRFSAAGQRIRRAQRECTRCISLCIFDCLSSFRAESSKFPESAPVLPSKAELTAFRTAGRTLRNATKLRA